MELHQVVERWRGLRAAPPPASTEISDQLPDSGWSLVDLAASADASECRTLLELDDVARRELQELRRMAQQWPLDRRGRASFHIHLERMNDPARFLLVNLTPGQREVYDVIRRLGQATTEQIMKLCPKQKKADTRRVELAAAGLIEALPKKVLTESGRLAQQWVVVDPIEVDRRRQEGEPPPPKPENGTQREAFSIIERLAAKANLRKSIEDFVAANKVDRLARRALLGAIHEIGAELRQLRQERKAALAAGAGAVELEFIDRKTQMRETVELLKAIERQLNADWDLPDQARYGTPNRRADLRVIAEDLAAEACRLVERLKSDDDVVEGHSDRTSRP